MNQKRKKNERGTDAFRAKGSGPFGLTPPRLAPPSGSVWLLPLGMLVLVSVLVPLQMLDEQGLPRCRALHEEKEQLEARNRILRGEIRRLRRQATALRDDPDAIERIARQELGLVKADEVVFQFGP